MRRTCPMETMDATSESFSERKRKRKREDGTEAAILEKAFFLFEKQDSLPAGEGYNFTTCSLS